MNHSKYIFILSLLLLLSIQWVFAQGDDATLPTVGDIPLAQKILVTVDEDDPTQALILGEVGAVYPNAFVAVQNLYTNDREVTSASSNGDFSVSLYGRDQTPYWIATFERFPSDADIDNATGTVVYGDGEANTFYIESDLGGNVSHYRLWGDYSGIQVKAGDEWTLSLDVEMDLVSGNLNIDDLRFGGELWLMPISDSPIQHNNAPWGSAVLESLLPVIGLDSEPIMIADTITRRKTVSGTNVEFELNFEAVIPELDTVGRHQVLFVGDVRVDDSEKERWQNSPLLGTQSDSLTDSTATFPIWLSNHDEPVEDLVWGLLPDNNQPLLSFDAMSMGFPTTPIWVNSQTILSPDNYSLEPFWVDELNMPIDDGQLTVSVTRPNGTSDDMDVDIVQVEHQLNSDVVTLATDSDRLSNYPFEEYGDYTVQLGGRLRIGEQSYFNGNMMDAYKIRIAEPLHLSPAFLAGTPLEVGDTIPIGLHLFPQVPADVTVTLTYLDGTTWQLEQQDLANEMGYFVGESILIEQAGVYMLTYEASYTDTEGRLWSGDLLTTSVVASPDSDLFAYGRRGLAGYEGVAQAWFDTTIYPDDDINATRQPYFPFYSSDVAYVPDALDSGIYPQLASNRSEYLTYPDLGYLTVTRPDVTLRQFVMGGDDPSVAFNGDDTFNQQMGAGIDGLQEGDFAFLFGGVSSGDEHAIYGSLMVVQDEDAPARVLSPFMDSLDVFGQTVDLFFVPTGIRPAQVLTLGDTLSIVGQAAPTLPAELEVTINSPSGERTRFTDVANVIGYFYSPENDIELDEIGIWQIDIEMTYHGETSAGQLERPYPKGALSYEIYVMLSDNPSLDEAEFMTETSSVTKTYALTIPDGWTDVRAFAMVTTPSWILSREELTVFPSGTSYTYNPTTLARDYPNIELLDTTDGNHVADVLTLTLVMTGADTDGKPAIRTRTYTITHDTTYAADGEVN